MLRTLRLKNFTGFDDITMDFVPGINVIIGENATGKTHLMKVAYAVCRPEAPKKVRDQTKLISNKLIRVFLPDNGQLGGLAKRPVKGDTEIEVALHDYVGDCTFRATLDFHSKRNFKTANSDGFKTLSRKPTFMPTKEVISFINHIVMEYDIDDSLIDDTYVDLCRDLDIDAPQVEDLDARAQWSLEQIKELCDGEFLYNDGDVVFLTKNSEPHSSLMIAEGYRKLGVLYRLLENGSISPSVSGPIFWDEPDANLNPRMLNLVARILLELCRNGQQIVVSTHNYVLLKEIDLERRKSDSIRFHALYREDDSRMVKITYSDDFPGLQKNAIAETYSSLYDRDLQRSLERLEP